MGGAQGHLVDVCSHAIPPSDCPPSTSMRAEPDLGPGLHLSSLSPPSDWAQHCSFPLHLEMPKGANGTFLNNHAAKLQGDHTGIVWGPEICACLPWWVVDSAYLHK